MGEPFFADHAAWLLTGLEPLSVKDTQAAMQDWLAHAEALADRPEPRPEHRNELHHSRADTGDWYGRWRLDTETGALFDRALREAFSHDCAGEPPRAAPPAGEPTPSAMRCGSSSTTRPHRRRHETTPTSKWSSTGTPPWAARSARPDSTTNR